MHRSSIKIFFAFIFLCLLNLNSAAQKGTPYINNFPMEDELNYRVWDMINLPNQEMLFTCRKGLLGYNGSKWNLHTLSSVPLVIETDERGRIFVGFRGDFGLVKEDSTGSYHFQSLLPDSSMKDVVFDEIYIEQDSVFFIGEKSVYLVDKNNKTSNFTFHQFDEHHGFFMHRKQLQVVTNNGICSVDPDSVDLFSNVTLPHNSDIFFHFKVKPGLTYLGASNNKLYQFDGENLLKVNIKDQAYLDESVLVDGLLLNDSLIALSTNIGGVLIINLNTGKTLYTINYTTGLPDNKVYDIYLDKKNGLWIAHGRGISRISLSLPIMLFNKYPGLSGNLYAFTRKQNEIYLGTSEGLYYLTKQKQYKTRQITVRVPEKTEAKTKKKKQVSAQEKPENTNDTKKKGRVRKFFRKVAQKIKAPIKKISGKESDKEQPQPQTVKKEPELTYRTRTIYSLQSISHAYKKVAEFKGKCFQLIHHNNQILAASNTGLYTIKKHKAKIILKDTYVNFIKKSRFDPRKLLVATNDEIIFLEYTGDNWNLIMKHSFDEAIYSIAEQTPKTIWVGGLGKAFKIDLHAQDSISTNVMHFKGNMLDEVVVRYFDKKLHFIVSSAIYILDNKQNKPIKKKEYAERNALDIFAFYNQPEYTWIKTNQWNLYDYYGEKKLAAIKYLKLLDNIDEAFLDENQQIWVIDNYNNLYRINNQTDSIYTPNFRLNIASIQHKGGAFLKAGDIKLEYEDNAITVKVSSPYFLKNNAVKYRYKLVGLTKKWSDWSNNEIINFPFIPAGTYYLLLESKTVLGNKSGITKIPVHIDKPFRQTIIFYLLVILLLTGVVFLIIILRERKLKRDKVLLEAKVKARTKTISEQKEEITVQHDEIKEQKNRIEQQHNDIKQSITYAKRIQAAALPDKPLIDRHLKDYFIFFKPRDIVSGDFYWINKIGNKTIVMAADCTGHGVPGAFMSMLGISFLNEITSTIKDLHADTILDELRRYVKETLSQEGKEGEAKDGMDASLMIIDYENKKAEFSGAFNPLYMIRGGELKEIKADKMPVGIYLKKETPFTNHEIELKQGDTFYMLSDGFPDQFGGKKGRKFMRKPFKRLLINMQDKSMEEQKDILDNTFREWLGTVHQQIDDVLVIGLRI